MWGQVQVSAPLPEQYRQPHSQVNPHFRVMNWWWWRWWWWWWQWWWWWRSWWWWLHTKTVMTVMMSWISVWSLAQSVSRDDRSLAGGCTMYNVHTMQCMLQRYSLKQRKTFLGSLVHFEIQPQEGAFPVSKDEKNWIWTSDKLYKRQLVRFALTDITSGTNHLNQMVL